MANLIDAVEIVGAADLGLGAGESSCGTFYVVPHSHWASSIRPGHGTDARCGLVNDLGKSAVFWLSTGSQPQVWCVRMSDLTSGATTDPRRMFIQRT